MNQIAKKKPSILVEHVKKIVVDYLDMTRPKGPLLGIKAVEEKKEKFTFDVAEIKLLRLYNTLVGKNTLSCFVFVYLY